MWIQGGETGPDWSCWQMVMSSGTIWGCGYRSICSVLSFGWFTYDMECIFTLDAAVVFLEDVASPGVPISPKDRRKLILAHPWDSRVHVFCLKNWHIYIHLRPLLAYKTRYISNDQGSKSSSRSHKGACLNSVGVFLESPMNQDQRHAPPDTFLSAFLCTYTTSTLPYLEHC